MFNTVTVYKAPQKNSAVVSERLSDIIQKKIHLSLEMRTIEFLYKKRDIKPDCISHILFLQIPTISSAIKILLCEIQNPSHAFSSLIIAGFIITPIERQKQQ